MNFEQARYNMIEQQIRPWKVLDPEVLSLLAVVKREDFVPQAYRSLAFVDMEIPLPAADGAQEWMLAPMVEARLLQELEVSKHETVLEIGTGSGYMAALLAHKGRNVISLEIRPELARVASDNLRHAAVVNANVRCADGAQLRPDEEPFDVIVLSGSVASVPSSVLTQLKVGGRLSAIVGQQPIMRAMRFTRAGEQDFPSIALFDTVAPRLHSFDEPTKFRF
jgi:protein-L-isoaspartate(D-aspartate) O-methyltransferase